MIRLLAGAIGLAVLATSALAADPVEIGIGYLHRGGIKPTLSLVEQPSENDGIAGARLAIEDNNTTGKFLNQHFTLEEVRLKDGDDAAKAAAALADRNIGFIIADLPADSLLKAADAVRDRGTVLFNAGSIDDRLREEDCRANVIHAAPTRSRRLALRRQDRSGTGIRGYRRRTPHRQWCDLDPAADAGVHPAGARL